MSELVRSARVGPGAAVGVTEELIAELVPAFYERVRRDPELGPIFERVVGGAWDAHLAKLCDFWSSVMLMSGRFTGQPMATHARLPDIAPAHFDRWLQIWRETTEELCPPEAAALFRAKAGMIAESLQLGIAASRGEIPPLPARIK